jgi:hypothetical protein
LRADDFTVSAGFAARRVKKNVKMCHRFLPFFPVFSRLKFSLGLGQFLVPADKLQPLDFSRGAFGKLVNTVYAFRDFESDKPLRQKIPRLVF